MHRIRTIDFLRGLAVILVLFRHHKYFETLHDIGWIGVDLFFVLSGYLVSSLLFKEFQRSGKINPARFLIRRGFKIYPLFYTAILVTIILESLRSEGTVALYNLISELLFLQNYLGALWEHTWSLAVEEHFYFGLTLILTLTSRLKLNENQKTALLTFVGIFVMCLILRTYNSNFTYTHKTHLFPTHLRMDSLVFGVFLSYFHVFKKEKLERIILKGNSILLLISALFIIPVFFFNVDTAYMNTIGLTLLYIGFGVLLMVFIVNPNVENFLNQLFGKAVFEFINTIGVYSYGIYIFHMFVARYLLDLIQYQLKVELHQAIEFIIYFSVSILIGILMSKIIEQPFLRLRENLVPSTIRKLKK